MKKASTIFLTKLFLIAITFSLYGQNNPDFSIPESDTIIVNSGSNYILLSNVESGDSIAQNLSIEISSANTEVVEIDSVSYKTGDKLAIVWVREKGNLGAADVSVSVTDSDGTTQKTTEIVVANYAHHGIKFEIHDAIFWQEVMPLDDTPIFDSIIQSTNMKAAYDDLDWDEVGLTVGAGCGGQWCDGHDFSTGFLRGFLVPEKSGNYTFYMNGDSDYAFFLSSNENVENAVAVAAKSDNHGKVGSNVAGRKSEPVALEANNVYAIYAAQWNVHNENGGIQWELPGEFSRRYIDGTYLYPDWDTQNPEKVNGLTVAAKGDKFLQLKWESASDNQKLIGYNIYLNGEKINSNVVVSTDFLLENLDFETQYSVAVTSVDLVNNESVLSEILNVTTHSEDVNAPIPPDNLIVDETSGLALKISWSGASDDITGIIGYNVYVNGEIYNDNLLLTNSSVLKVLQPETEYSIQIEAVDAGLNVSEKSQVFKVTTSSFNPTEDNLGLKTGKFEFTTEAISFNEGLGINTDYKNGAVFNSAHSMLLEDLKPGCVRWGALTANPLSFKDYTGAGKNVTIGKFFNLCNDLSAYTVFCCGVENGTDWIKNDETFIRFLEYVNGPDDSEGGKLRVAEGYSEPFLKNSKGLIFEFGNEVWGGNAHNAQIGENYNNYADWCREIATKMRASEYYDSTKIVMVYSSRYPSREHSYGLNDKIIVGDTGEVDWTGPSGYIGGNLNYDPAFPPAESELEYYQNVRNRADNYLKGMVSSHKFEVERTGRIFKQYMYESNTSTPTYNQRLGQALFSTDYYLTSMELGSAIPTIFHLTGGQWRITEPENSYRRLPLFLTAKYFNEMCKGDVLNNSYTPNIGSKTGPGETFAKRPVGSFAYRNEEGYTVVLISRDYENDHFIEINIPEDIKYNTEGKIFSLTGEDFNTKNAVVDSVEIEIKNKMIVKVPKHGMLFLHIDADSIEMTNLPLAYYDYPRMEEVRIYAPKNEFTKPNQKLSFRVYVEPDNSWDKIVEWSLINNSGNYRFETFASYCHVYSGNKTANEGDSIILRASNRYGDIFDEVVLYTPETAVYSEINKFEEELKVYPNPTSGSVMVSLKTSENVKIYSLSGTKVYEQLLYSGNNEIDVSNLQSGIYALIIGNKTEKLIVGD